MVDVVVGVVVVDTVVVVVVIVVVVVATLGGEVVVCVTISYSTYSFPKDGSADAIGPPAVLRFTETKVDFKRSSF